MVFESILNPRKKSDDYYQAFGMPASFVDLNLDGVMNEIKLFSKGKDVLKFYYDLPKQTEIIRYRQGACRDLENPVIWDGVFQFIDDMNKAGEFAVNSVKSTMMLQRECWHMNAAYYYCSSVRRLLEALQQGAPTGVAFQSMREWLEDFVSQPDFIQFEQETKVLMNQFSQIRYTMTLEEDLVRLSRDVVDGTWNVDLTEMENPYGSILQLSRMEELVLSMLEKSDREEFAKFHDYYKRYREFMNDTLLLFEKEVLFYTNYLNYIKKLEKEGFPFCYPEITDEEFCVEDCYDVALARKNSMENKAVIQNGIRYESGERFFVITGPNQGGKTTFARAMGHVVYFSMLGLKAPGRKLAIPLFHDVVTHFATEESVETGSGKLKEELDRLAPLMHNAMQHNFVLINELFTTATTYDAHIMGTRVMKYFMEHNCQGIYVTHIQELAQEMEGVTSLVASVDDADSHIRTYKMRRRAPEGNGYASDIVEKYNLTLEDLKRRLAL